ncbi:MAG: DUF3048 domain-containing protein [Propionibacteriaceae bacterium]|nr:DUF3048 domain-containing protein [Propionibacteriaceae bacterium]
MSSPSHEWQPPDDGDAQRARAPRWRTWLIIITAVVVVAAGTTVVVSAMTKPKTLPSQPIASGVPSPSPSPSPRSVPTPTETTATWPLTGMPGDVVQRPALVIKVENSSDARPQEGLDSADVVFEEMVEGGISRYVAMFNSTLPTHVVPVRSIRPMDGPIAGWTNGVIVFAGGKDRFKTRAQTDGLQLISTGSGLGRVSDRVAPHNLAGNPEKLLARADANHQAPPPPFATFASGGAPGTAQTEGTPASKLTVNISSIAQPRWTWDGQKWLRFEKDKPAVVVSGTQLSATNVLVLGVDIVMQPEVDANNVHVPESIVTGQGQGLLASGGASVPITWKKDTETSVWQFLDANGQPVTLLPGITWVELVPNGTGNWSVS